ncbi:hypothetical protein [Lederbergia panacisoli]|uniref:hypothetical protein n=1 Tax=Lederbergia panacisoli TaxID=1255251 RepID=UPI00214C9128|nr:hypothetical protein [Lederbergia panacisoli]MCR2823452.1 hypothetical protein [Lederbergia panacisoli]
MDKKFSLLNIILFSLFIFGTIITLIIVYKDIDNLFSIRFVIGYVIYLLIYALYMCIVALVNIRTLTGEEFRKRILKFITLFILFSASNYILIYFIQPTKNSSYGFLFIGLGCALGLSFMDLAFFKKKRG